MDFPTPEKIVVKLSHGFASKLRDALPNASFIGVRNRMRKLLGSQLKAFELANLASHADAMLALRQAVEGFVVIFAHDSGDYLRGGEDRSRASGENIEIDKFLTRDDLSAFSGMVVFCMSCDSNELAQASLDAGAIGFFGKRFTSVFPAQSPVC